MGTHHKLSSQERDKIAWWAACWIPLREMARRLGRSPSTLCDEVKRNQAEGRYGSITAHQAAEARKRNCHKKYLMRMNPTLARYVLEKLKGGWSPQQIAGRMKKEIREGLRPTTEYINHESIYQFIYDSFQKAERLWEYLPRSPGLTHEILLSKVNQHLTPSILILKIIVRH